MAAQRKVRKEALQATVRAGTELDNKRRCIEKERSEQAKQTNASSLTTAKAPPAKATMNQSSPVLIEVYIRVEPDLSPGMLSYGGTGWLIAFDESGVEVKYDECSGLGGNFEKGVPFSRITVLPLPALAASVQ